MSPIRFRVLILSPAAPEPSPPPLSYWFIDREDAELVAQASATDGTAVALVGYDESGRPTVLRFIGTDRDRAWFMRRPVARDDEPSLDEIAFFASTDRRRRPRGTRLAAPALP
ncbi:hypothetical protein [Prosthecomicrobium sp. N25]|uniref:hypothetical protein n=1 Tax=Prosthecomicrobium sp. N25 TaxID=3129254 RepID=UPI003077001B